MHIKLFEPKVRGVRAKFFRICGASGGADLPHNEKALTITRKGLISFGVPKGIKIKAQHIEFTMFCRFHLVDTYKNTLKMKIS